MAEHSTIEWTDATWNVITGCSIESPGCKRCYAMKLAGGRLRNHPSRRNLTQPSDAGPVWTGDVRFNREWLDQPLKWTRPRDIFVCAHSDLFHPNVADEWLQSVFYVMQRAAHHRYQVLTKRPQRALQWLSTFAGTMPHVLIGASVESQQYADVRRDSMRAIAARGWRTWVSYEPALGPVDWKGWEFLRWMVSGGESGPNARASNADWHRGARDWCAAHAVPYHFKQWGAWVPIDMPTEEECFVDDGSDRQITGRAVVNFSRTMAMVGKKVAGRLLDGIEHNGLPT
jgi:protein gp37